MHWAKGGAEAWGFLWAGDIERAHIEIVAVAPIQVSLTLAQPAAEPEVIGLTTGDFPYLTPIPGTKLGSSRQDPSPFYVTPKGASVPELVAPSSIVKAYRVDGEMSNSMFHILYKDALVKAGWSIVNEFEGSDVQITAHYAKGKRNIWAVLHKSDSYQFQVADAGAAAAGLSADLAKNCHVAVYGILFDFNKATLQPASDAVLQKILDLFTTDATLKLEIQGHTDNVGGDAYNQTLSEARAKSVVAWLAQHGVAAARLTSKGYGKTAPVADNSSDVGRAKNRRVEIADPRCAAKKG